MKSDLSSSKSYVARRIPKEPELSPVRLLEVEIAQPLPDVSLIHPETGQCYSRALSLVRLHTRPLGLVELRPSGSGISAQEYAREIWSALGPQIIEHLRQDGLPPVGVLNATGLPSSCTPKCLRDRQSVLEDPPFVSVIVTTRDRPGSLAECLGSIFCIRYPRFEIVVIDNAPTTSATRDLVNQTYSDVPQLRYIREDQPGLSRARNCGLMAAQGDITVFTDDDVVADPHWLTALVEGFGVGDNVACVTGLILPRELETPAQIWCEQHGGFGKGFSRRIFDLAEHRPADHLFPYRVSTLGSGANMAFQTSILRDLGGFDPALGAGTITLSATEFPALFQTVTHGYQIVYEPAAIIYHAHHRDYDSLRRQLYGYGVGYTAFLTKCIVENPKLILDLFRKVPYGLFFALSPHSEKNQNKIYGYPNELNRIEIEGMLCGPFAYLRSRWNCRGVESDYESKEYPKNPRATKRALRN